jgi:hypothetical protein
MTIESICIIIINQISSLTAISQTTRIKCRSIRIGMLALAGVEGVKERLSSHRLRPNRSPRHLTALLSAVNIILSQPWMSLLIYFYLLEINPLAINYSSSKHKENNKSKSKSTSRFNEALTLLASLKWSKMSLAKVQTHLFLNAWLTRCLIVKQLVSHLIDNHNKRVLDLTAAQMNRSALMHSRLLTLDIQIKRLKLLLRKTILHKKRKDTPKTSLSKNIQKSLDKESQSFRRVTLAVRIKVSRDHLSSRR